MDVNIYSCFRGLLFLFSISKSVIQCMELTFELPADDEMCFGENFKDSKLRVVEYHVLRGGHGDVDLDIKSPNGKLIYNSTKKQTEKVSFHVSYGDYEFCFRNFFSSPYQKIIYFSLRKEQLDNLAVEAGNLKPMVKTAFESSGDEIHEMMTLVVDYQRDYRFKEMASQFAAGQLNYCVQLWSIVQAMVILISGFGQIFILKTFFTEKANDNIQCT